MIFKHLCIHFSAIEIEEDGISYLAGWLAFKYKDKYPHLGEREKYDHNYNLPSWIQQLSLTLKIKFLLLRVYIHYSQLTKCFR